jgi:hypothetical protein
MILALMLGLLFLANCQQDQPPPTTESAEQGESFVTASAVSSVSDLAEQGNAQGQHALGVLNYEGEGVPEDDVLAHMWFNLASSGPSGEDRTEQAAEARAKIANEMTPEDISEARDWPVSGNRKSNREAPEGKSFPHENFPAVEGLVDPQLDGGRSEFLVVSCK